jgi:hypothetical protein
MTTEPQAHAHACPECGAEIPAGARQCWLCHRPLETEGVPAPAGMPAARRAIGLGFWVLLLALVVVLIGAILEYPGLGILVAVVGTPALVLVFQRARPGGDLEKASGLLATAGAVLAVVVASVIAFVAVCFPVGLLAVVGQIGEQNKTAEQWGVILLIAAWPLGIAAGLTVGWFLFRRLWPKKHPA